MKAFDLRFTMDVYLVNIVMPDTFSSTFSIAHSIASWTKDVLGDTGDVRTVVCSMEEALYSEGYYTLAVVFDWPPHPREAISALGQASAKLGCASMTVSDPLNYGLPVHQCKPFYASNDILSAALKQIRDNKDEFLNLAAQGRDCYKLSCNSLYA